jgi:hypothetical protein
MFVSLACERSADTTYPPPNHQSASSLLPTANTPQLQSTSGDGSRCVSPMWNLARSNKSEISSGARGTRGQQHGVRVDFALVSLQLAINASIKRGQQSRHTRRQARPRRQAVARAVVRCSSRATATLRPRAQPRRSGSMAQRHAQPCGAFQQSQHGESAAHRALKQRTTGAGRAQQTTNGQIGNVQGPRHRSAAIKCKSNL